MLASVTEPAALNDWIRQFRPEIIFHLAAQPLVSASYDQPQETFATNVMGLVNLFEAVRSEGSVKAVVVISSDKCYQNNNSGAPLDENCPLGGDDPYSSSKACVELISHSYSKSFFGPIANCLLATARAGNVIGGGDWASDRLIPDIIRALEADRTILVRNPTHVRPWQHVLDPLRGYLTLGEKLLTGDSAAAQAWNFGPTEQSNLTVKDIVEHSVALWGGGDVKYVPGSSVFYESSKLNLNVKKANDGLNFQNWWPTTKSLERTLIWYRKVVFDGRDALDVTEKQICDYLS